MYRRIRRDSWNRFLCSLFNYLFPKGVRTMKRLFFLAFVFGCGALLGSPLRSYADFTWSSGFNGIAQGVTGACQATGTSCVPTQNCTDLDPTQNVYYNGMDVVVASYQWKSDYTWGSCTGTTGTCQSWGAAGAPCAIVTIYGATGCTSKWGTVVVRAGTCSNG
jgi:hypothetical protein